MRRWCWVGVILLAGASVLYVSTRPRPRPIDPRAVYDSISIAGDEEEVLRTAAIPPGNYTRHGDVVYWGLASSIQSSAAREHVWTFDELQIYVYIAADGRVLGKGQMWGSRPEQKSIWKRIRERVGIKD